MTLAATQLTIGVFAIAGLAVVDRDGTTMHAMMFDGSMPGPTMVVHEGDYLELTLVNPASNTMPHNVDFHASTGALGGVAVLQVPSTVADEIHLLFVEADVEEADDPDVYPIDPRAQELDLRPAVREQWLLSAPAFVQCRDDCKGLCPSCGADRNAGDCGCASATSYRRSIAARRASASRGSS